MFESLCCAIAAIGLHAGSLHVDKSEWLERQSTTNANVGGYVLFESGLTLGTYRNTLRSQSFYGGWTWQTESTRLGSINVSPAVTVGVVSGYPGKAIQPYLLPSLDLQPNNSSVSVRIGYLPRTKATQAHVIHVMIERKF